MMPYNPNYAQQSMDRYAMQQQQNQQRSYNNPAVYSNKPLNNVYHTNQLDTFQAPQSLMTNSLAMPKNDLFGDVMQHHKQMMKDMNKMTKHFDKQFGNFDMSPFGNFGSQIMKNFDREFNSFSKMHDDLFNQVGGGGPATMVSRTYVHSKKKDANGKFYEEAEFSNNVAQRDKNGHTISERQQAYKNSGNQQQVIAQERMLNDQGRKFVKQRFGNNGQVQEKNYLYNLSENNFNDFDSKWNQKSLENNFQDTCLKYLGGSKNNYLTSQSHQDMQYKQKKTKPSQQNYYQQEYMDNRGHHVPYQKKLPNQPVQYQQKPAYFPRQIAHDLQPQQVGQGNQNASTIQQQPQPQRNVNRVSQQNNYQNLGGVGQRIQQASQVQNQPGVFKNKGGFKNQLPNIG